MMGSIIAATAARRATTRVKTKLSDEELSAGGRVLTTNSSCPNRSEGFLLSCDSLDSIFLWVIQRVPVGNHEVFTSREVQKDTMSVLILGRGTERAWVT